jgi:hypothetical protein
MKKQITRAGTPPFLITSASHQQPCGNMAYSALLSDGRTLRVIGPRRGLANGHKLEDWLSAWLRDLGVRDITTSFRRTP